MGETDTERRDQGEGEAPEEQKEDLLEPSVEVDEAGPWKRRLKVEIAAEKVAAEYEKQLKELSRTADVPGFRRGRAPRKLLLNRFGEALTGDVKMRLVTRGLEEAMRASDLEAVSEPLFGPDPAPAEQKEGGQGGEEPGGEEAKEPEGKEAKEPPSRAEAGAKYLKDLPLKPDDALAFEFTVEVKPTFDVPEYKGLKLTRRTRPVTDDRVERFIDSLRSHEADFEPVEEGAVRPGDRLTVKARVDCDGETAWESESAVVRLTDRFVAGLPAMVEFSAVEGMELDEERTVDVQVAESFEKEELRGKDAELTLKLLEIKRAVLPALDDEAARRLGAPGAEELRQEARGRLEAEARADAADDLESQIADNLLGAVDFDLPQGLLEQESRGREVRQMLRLAQLGIAPDSLKEEHLETIRSSARRSTDRSLKLGLILGRIADAEDIEVTDEDLEDEILRFARARRRTPVSVRSELERTGRLEDLQGEMLSAKVINFIIEQADKANAQEDPGAGGAAGSPDGGAQ